MHREWQTPPCGQQRWRQGGWVRLCCLRQSGIESLPEGNQDDICTAKARCPLVANKDGARVSRTRCPAFWSVSSSKPRCHSNRHPRSEHQTPPCDQQRWRQGGRTSEALSLKKREPLPRTRPLQPTQLSFKMTHAR